METTVSRTASNINHRNRSNTVNLNEVVIAVGTMSSEELNTVVEAIRCRRERIAQTAKRAFRVGDRVEWVKDGRTYKGVICAIGPKNVKAMSEENVRWTIHPNLLTKSA